MANTYVLVHGASHTGVLLEEVTQYIHAAATNAIARHWWGTLQVISLQGRDERCRTICYRFHHTEEPR